MTRDEQITGFLHGRPLMILSAIAFAACGVGWGMSGQLPKPEQSVGVFFSLNAAMASPLLSAVLNVVCVIACGAILIVLNKLFNFIRAYTFVFVSMFFLLEMSTPATAAQLSVGSALCLATVVGMLPMFASYESNRSQGRIFLTMVILSSATLWQWAAVVLIPAFFVGFIQMRAMHWRAFLAAVLGLATPVWIVLGLGLANPVTDYHSFDIGAAWQSIRSGQIQLLVGWTAALTLVSIGLSVINLFTIMNFRLQFRVYNAFFMVVNLLVVIAMILDRKDISAFLPLLNMCIAVQTAHWLTLNSHPKRYLLVLILMVLCLIHAGSTMFI